MSNIKLESDLSDYVEQELRRLCITGKYLGLPYLVFAVQRTVVDPNKVKNLSKELYCEVAQEFDASLHSVERAIRTAIMVCWERGGREMLDKMIGRHLTERPTNCEFIDQVSNYIQRTY